MATETLQIIQSKQPGKQEYKEEVKGTTDDGSTFTTTREVIVGSSSEPSTANPLRAARADSVIHRNVLWALGAGLTPIPLVDFVAVTGVQMKMLKELSDLYGVGFTSSLAKKIILSLLSGLGSVGLGTVVGLSLSKLLPVVGTTVGVVSVPIFAGAFTNAVGRIFMMHFESGGTLLDFDPIAMHSYFKREFERSKETVSRMQREEARVEY